MCHSAAIIVAVFVAIVVTLSYVVGFLVAYGFAVGSICSSGKSKGVQVDMALKIRRIGLKLVDRYDNVQNSNGYEKKSRRLVAVHDRHYVKFVRRRKMSTTIGSLRTGSLQIVMMGIRQYDYGPRSVVVVALVERVIYYHRSQQPNHFTKTWSSCKFSMLVINIDRFVFPNHSVRHTRACSMTEIVERVI